MTPQQQATTAIHRELCRQRRAIGAASPEACARVYLAHHFSLPPSPMHVELFGLLADATKRRGASIAVAAPRGHAKSTVVSLAYVLWSVLYGHDAFVWIVSATREQSAQLLKHVKDEIETNPMLAMDFPDSVGPIVKGERPIPWRGSLLQLPGGASLRALSLDQNIRGIKHRQHRPSLIVVDDLESHDQVLSEESRSKLREQFERTLLKAGDTHTNVIVVGTVLHHDSLLARLTTPATAPGWIGRRYRALISEPCRTDLWQRWESVYVAQEEWAGSGGPDAARVFFAAHRATMEEGAKALWPEKDSLEALMEMRARNRHSFAAEKQNEPLDPALCVFKEEMFHFWDNEFADEAALRKHFGQDLEIVGAWDPSVGSNPTRGDYSAIILLAKHRPTEVCYVIAADIARRTPPDAIKKIIEHLRLVPAKRISVEDNGFQKMVIEELRIQLGICNMQTYIHRCTNHDNKVARISMLQTAIAQGRIRFSRRHPLLLEQLRQFPLGKHDDGPDALQMAWEASKDWGLGVYLPERPDFWNRDNTDWWW